MADAQQPRDEELVERMRAGDADAARTLFERHKEALRARVRRRLPRLLRGKVAASDVIQETWLAAFLQLSEFEDRGDASFARWVNGILEHKVLDVVRRLVDADKRDARRESRLATSASRAGVVARESSASVHAMAVERAMQLRDEIDRLSDAHREILRLVHDQGLTLVAAGERLGRSADAARKLYGRALAELTERLSGRGEALA